MSFDPTKEGVRVIIVFLVFPCLSKFNPKRMVINEGWPSSSNRKKSTKTRLCVDCFQLARSSKVS